MHLLYLHGLGSNGQSSTAAALAEDNRMTITAPSYASQHFPQSMAQLSAVVEEVKPDVIVGTSMGGYYALKLRERYDISTVVVNPCFDPANHLRKYLVTPATNYETGEPIVFDNAMIEAFEDLEPGPPIQDRTILIGLNDDVIHPSTQRAFCERFGWEYTTVPWGHRVGDADRLLEEIGGVPALHADVRKVMRLRENRLEVYPERAERQAQKAKSLQFLINRAEEAVKKNQKLLAEALLKKENRANPRTYQMAMDDKRIRRYRERLEDSEEQLKNAVLSSSEDAKASSRSVSTVEASTEPQITWRGADVMVSTLPLPYYQGSSTLVVSPQARKINIAMRALIKIDLYSVNYFGKLEFFGRIAASLNNLSEQSRADEEIAVTTVFDTALKVLRDWIETLEAEKPKTPDQLAHMISIDQNVKNGKPRPMIHSRFISANEVNDGCSHRLADPLGRQGNSRTALVRFRRCR